MTGYGVYNSLPLWLINSLCCRLAWFGACLTSITSIFWSATDNTEKKLVRIAKSFPSILIIILPIGVYWQIKWIHIDKKEEDNPKKFDQLVKAIRFPKSVPYYSTLIWEVK